MSYAVQPPVTAPPPPAVAPGPQRPLPASLAALVLQAMAVVGLIYAVVTIVTAPGSVSRFRDAAAGAAAEDVDGYVSVIWIGAAIGLILALILVALYIVLALGLRRGSNAARIATWVVCGLGLLAGLGSTITVLVQRSGDSHPQSLAAALSGSYPSYWIHLNLTLAIAQVAGYVVVGLLVLLAGGAWFGRGPAAPQAPTYGQQPYGQPGYGGYGAPGSGPGSITGGYPPAPFGPGYGTGSGGPGPVTPSYGPPGAGYTYGAPYGPGPSPAPGAGSAPIADQAYQPGAGQQWTPPGAPQGQPQTGPPGSAPGQPFGLPPVHPGSSGPAAGETPDTPRPSGPDDEFWSRPSS
jgi:hypothetical protein